MYIEVAIIVATVVFSIVIYFRRKFSYWEKRSVPFRQPSIPWGTSGNPLTNRKPFHIELKEYYDDFKSNGHILGGLFMLTQPALLLVKPDLHKRILAKDFPHFTGHGVHIDEENDPISGMLALLNGEKWRNMRVKLTPIFTSGKIKMMFQAILTAGGPMINHISDLIDKDKFLDIKEISSCFTTDVIGSAAFGIECDSFKNPDAEFRKRGRSIFEPTWKNNLFRVINLLFKLRLDATDHETINFFTKSFENIIEYRERNNVQRNDFVQLLMGLRSVPEEGKDGLTLNQMTAQALNFFVAGFETSSTTMTFCLHELSYNVDVQDRLRNEIIETLNKFGGEITYEAIMEIKYLDMVIDETLRKYPAAANLHRVCNKKYVIEETGLVIEEGTPVFMSILGLHRDPEYFPNPDKFDPERFSDVNKPKIPHFTYLPFGEGPRICIGLRFGVMQAKVGLCMLLTKFKFTPHESMRYEMEFQYGTIVPTFKDAVLLNGRKIK